MISDSGDHTVSRLPQSCRCHAAFSFLPTSVVVCLWWLLTLNGDTILTPAIAQSPNAAAAPPNHPNSPPAGSAGAPGLTDGLLDLLTEPTAQPQPTLQSRRLRTEAPPLGTPGGGLPANPLEAVRDGMLMAADFLEQGQADAGTQQLQTDVVKRLDELINQLDRPPPPSSPSPSSQQSPSRSDSSDRDASKQQQSSPSRSEPGQGPPPGDARQKGKQQRPSGPGSDEFQPTNPAAAEVLLADPKALQERVWGQLPERTRQQMQSRMVEQFLPSYRQEIEAYYRALAK